MFNPFKKPPDPKYCTVCGAPLETNSTEKVLGWDPQTGKPTYAQTTTLFCPNKHYSKTSDVVTRKEA